MWLLFLIGAGMSVLGLIMLIKPLTFAAGITAFSEKNWFHSFEILSRLILGLLFLLVANTTAYPLLFNIIGVVLCSVAVFLLVMGVERHKQFARLTAKVGYCFRPIGICATLLGAGLIYMGISHYV